MKKEHLRRVVRSVLNKNKKLVKRYISGETVLLNYFMGRVFAKMDSDKNVGVVRELLKGDLKKRGADMKKSLSLEKINKLASELKNENPAWRYGQAYFNAIYILYPDIANDLRGTTCDPFHHNDNLDKCREYLNKLKYS